MRYRVFPLVQKMTTQCVSGHLNTVLFSIRSVRSVVGTRTKTGTEDHSEVIDFLNDVTLGAAASVETTKAQKES